MFLWNIFFWGGIEVIKFHLPKKVKDFSFWNTKEFKTLWHHRIHFKNSVMQRKGHLWGILQHNLKAFDHIIKLNATSCTNYKAVEKIILKHLIKVWKMNFLFLAIHSTRALLNQSTALIPLHVLAHFMIRANEGPEPVPIIELICIVAQWLKRLEVNPD